MRKRLEASLACMLLLASSLVIFFPVEAVTVDRNTDPVFDDVISGKIYNYNEIKSYCPESELSSYNYVIIANESVGSAIINFKNWKETIGYNVKIVNASYIYRNYQGDDKPEQIRNFLIDKYTEWGIKYVLIIGSHQSIPMRYCYPDPNNHNSGDWKIPTDHYYADLTGDWDADGDGFYGERNEDDVDFYPEDDQDNIQNICTKTMIFEQDNGEWKQRALLLGAKTVIDGGCSDRYMEKLKRDIFQPRGYEITTMYEKEGWKPSPIQCDYPITKSNVLNVWPNGYGIVTWHAHGNSDTAYRLVWRWFKEEWHSFFQTKDVSVLDDEKPSIVFSVSCHNAKPEDVNNLGTALIKHGAVSFIGSTRLGFVIWGDDTYGGDLRLNYHFHHYFNNKSQTVSESLFNAKLCTDEYGSGIVDVNQYGFNLYGDPSLRIEGCHYTPVHNIDTGEDFRNIQAAIDDSDTQKGHTIKVDVGNYYETVNIHKGVRLTGDNKNKPVIDGGGNDTVVFFSSDGGSIAGFTILNGAVGINIVDSSDIIIHDNDIVNNEYGIKVISSSENNLFYHNNFIDNDQNAYDECINFWDNGYPSGGNYWDDYTGYDNNDDGIGENPYNITDGSNKDNYPFIEQNGWLQSTNRPPNKPNKPSGQIKGKIGQNYSYTTSTTDPEGDQLYYNWSWGDGTYSGWIGPYNNGEIINKSHSWMNKGNYYIKVKAKDIFGIESDWSDPLEFSTIKKKVINIPLFLQRFFQRFPLFEKILKQIISIK
jgi:parallel beta-helix repeat protein